MHRLHSIPEVTISSQQGSPDMETETIGSSKTLCSSVVKFRTDILICGRWKFSDFDALLCLGSAGA